MLDLAVRYSYARDVEVRRAAAALLAAIGAEDAVERLILLLVDDAAPVRSAAAYALGAMGEWRAARALGDRLDDDDADVRFAVAVSLQRLGPPGRVVLRRVINHGPQRAATVARESLDLIARLSA